MFAKIVVNPTDSEPGTETLIQCAQAQVKRAKTGIVHLSVFGVPSTYGECHWDIPTDGTMELYFMSDTGKTIDRYIWG